LLQFIATTFRSWDEVKNFHTLWALAHRTEKNLVKEKNFEQAMKRLEEIVQQLEEGELPLEKSLKIFEEGVNLSKFLTKKLSEAEAKVQKLIKTQKGEYKTEPLDVEKEEEELL
jgi:exodeoxyribonuclease VII small subunit